MWITVYCFCRLQHFCKLIYMDRYFIWQILLLDILTAPSIVWVWLRFVMFSLSLIKAICIGFYLIWRILIPSQICQLKSLPNINSFSVIFCHTSMSPAIKDSVFILYWWLHHTFEHNKQLRLISPCLLWLKVCDLISDTILKPYPLLIL